MGGIDVPSTGGGAGSLFGSARTEGQVILDARRAIIDAPGRLVGAIRDVTVGETAANYGLFPVLNPGRELRQPIVGRRGGLTVPGLGGGAVLGGGTSSSQSAVAGPRERATVGVPTAADDLDIGPTAGTGGGGGDFPGLPVSGSRRIPAPPYVSPVGASAPVAGVPSYKTMIGEVQRSTMDFVPRGLGPKDHPAMRPGGVDDVAGG
jgi:hypothetical protein